MEKVFNAPSESLYINVTGGPPIILSKWIYLLINVFLIISFTYCYVQWLWQSHLSTISLTFLRDFINSFLPLFIISSAIFVSIYLVFISGFIPFNTLLYGVLITFAWFITVILSLWRAI